MKANFEKLHAFVGGAIDFGALASAMNFAKMLAQDGYKHVKGIKEKDLGGPSNLGVTSCDVRRSAHDFMKSF